MGVLYIHDDIDSVAKTTLQNAEDITITEEINGEYTLEFVLPFDDVKVKYITVGTLVKSDFNNQIYRIEKIGKSNKPPLLNVYCKHIYHDNTKKFVAKFDAIIGQYANTIFSQIWANSDFAVLTSGELENLGLTAVSTYTDLESKDKTTAEELTNLLIEACGQGEVYIDNDKIALVEEIGAGYAPIALNITKNMDSLDVEIDFSDVITRLYAFGKENRDLATEYGEMYIDSPNIEDYGVLEGYVDFTQISDIDMLHDRAQWAFDADNPNRIDEPYVSISGKYVSMTEATQQPHLGQRVTVEDYANQRIIKIVWKPQKPFETEITVGQIKKDLFYYFKRFNNTTTEYNANIKNIKNNTEVTQTIVEVTKQEVVAADVIEASTAFIDDLQVERLETNVKSFICEPNLTDKGEWAATPHTYKARTTGNIRGYIRIEGLTQTYIEAHLTVPSDYNAITVDNLTPLTVNNKQLYFTSVSGSQAFLYLTFVNPKTKYPNLTSDQAEKYKVYMRKSENEYIKMQQLFEWSVTDNTYYVNTVYGTGDANGNGKYYFVKDADSGRFVYKSRTDGLEYGVAIKDDAPYLVTGGQLTQMYPIAVRSDVSDVSDLPVGTIIFQGAVN